MKVNKLVMGCVLTGGMVFGLPAQSAPIMDFQASKGSSSVQIVDSEDLSIGDFDLALADSLGEKTYELEEGDTATFDFFRFKLPKLGVGDTTVEASLGFIKPEQNSGEGEGAGKWFNFFGVSGGKLTWDKQPGDFETSNGSVFSISFNDLTGIDVGKEHTVTASVTAESVNQVPEPGTLALLGLGLLGIGARMRNRG